MRPIPIAAALVALLLPLAPLAADDDSPRLKMHVEGEEGGHFDLDLSAGWLKTLFSHAEIDCHGSADRDSRRMAEALDRGGEGSVYRFRDDDGRRVVARRSHGQLEIEKSEKDGGASRVEMPWVLADCLFLGHDLEGRDRDQLGHDGIHLRVHDSDGGEVEIDFD
jgi:hypothetical protein